MEAIARIALFLLLIGYIAMYAGSRRYLYEYFQPTASSGAPPVTVAMSKAPFHNGEAKTLELAPVEVPYTTAPINGVDDYEYNKVFQNESDKALTKALRDKLMSQHPMDWSGQPPSSSQFQAGLRESFENAKPTVPDDAKPYQNIGGNLMQPPDLSKVEMEERKILQTYKPKFPPGPTTYDPRDANELITQLYDAKGLIPEVRHKDGTNVYEIIGVRKKGDHVLFEDEAVAEATTKADPKLLESTIKTPQAVADMNPPTDSMFDPGTKATETKSRTNQWNYTSWTQGLERMFAPTDPQQQWY